MNNDLIKRSELKKALDTIKQTGYDTENEPLFDYVELPDLIKAIDNAPTVELRDVFDEGYEAGKAVGRKVCDSCKIYKRPQGEWIKQYGKSYELKTNEGVLVGEFTKCPKCQYDKARGSNFCPNCGAKMGAKEE